MVHPLGVVPQAPCKKSLIEGSNVGQKLAAVVIRILFLHRAVEPLAVSVHLWCPWPGLVVGYVKLFNSLSKILLELRAIVGQHIGKGKWKHLSHQFEELFRCLGGMRSGGQGKAKPGVEVYEGGDVSSTSINVLLKGVESNTVARIACEESVRFPNAFLAFDGPYLPHAGNTLGSHSETAQVVDDPSNGAGLGALQSSGVAELLEERAELLLAKVGVVIPESCYFLD